MQKYFLFIVFFLGSVISSAKNNNIKNDSNYTINYDKYGNGSFSGGQGIEFGGIDKQGQPTTFGKSKYDDLKSTTIEQSKNPELINEIREQGRKETLWNYIEYGVFFFLLIVFVFFFRKYNQKQKRNIQEKVSSTNTSTEKIGLKNIATELEKINDLKTKGIITEDEFLKLKERIIK